MKAANDNYPLVMTRPQAAALCGLTPAGFDVWVRKGIVPPAIQGTRRWSRTAIERAVSGDAIPSDLSVTVELDPYEKWKRDNVRKA